MSMMRAVSHIIWQLGRMFTAIFTLKYSVKWTHFEHVLINTLWTLKVPELILNIFSKICENFQKVLLKIFQKAFTWHLSLIIWIMLIIDRWQCIKTSARYLIGLHGYQNSKKYKMTGREELFWYLTPLKYCGYKISNVENSFLWILGNQGCWRSSWQLTHECSEPELCHWMPWSVNPSMMYQKVHCQLQISLAEGT